MNKIVPLTAEEYCRQCGDVLTDDGFCMRCDGGCMEDEAEEVCPGMPPTQEVNLDIDSEPAQYEYDSIANGPREERNTDDDDESGDVAGHLS